MSQPPFGHGKGRLGVSEWGLTYGDLFEEWEIAATKRAVIEFRSKYPWLRGLDFDDLLQECLIHWYFKRSRFREGKGASIQTFMAKVVRTHLRLMLRQQLSHRRRASHLADSLDRPVAASDISLADVVYSHDDLSHVNVRVDVESALEQLTPFERQICILLIQGYPVTSVADLLGRPRRSVRDAVARIRQVFSGKGLEAYLE